jgi:hypothetical protein
VKEKSEMKRLPVELKQQRRADHTVREGKQVPIPSAKPDKNMLCSILVGIGHLAAKVNLRTDYLAGQITQDRSSSRRNSSARQITLEDK